LVAGRRVGGAQTQKGAGLRDRLRRGAEDPGGAGARMPGCPPSGMAPAAVVAIEARWGCGKSDNRSVSETASGASDPALSWDLIVRLSHRAPAAAGDQVLAEVLVAVQQRWRHSLVVHGMPQALVFTQPGEDYPYTARVIIRWGPEGWLVSCWREHRLAWQTGCRGARHRR